MFDSFYYTILSITSEQEAHTLISAKELNMSI